MAGNLNGRVAIIGAGYAGMAAAVELADAGIKVDVFEASRTLGGRARAIELDPAHIDAWYEWVDNRQRTGDHAGALDLIADGLKALGGNGDLMYRKFYSLLKGGSPAAAYELLEHLLHHDGEGADVLITAFPELRDDLRFMQRYAHFKGPSA